MIYFLKCLTHLVILLWGLKYRKKKAGPEALLCRIYLHIPPQWGGHGSGGTAIIPVIGKLLKIKILWCVNVWTVISPNDQVVPCTVANAASGWMGEQTVKNFEWSWWLKSALCKHSPFAIHLKWVELSTLITLRQILNNRLQPQQNSVLKKQYVCTSTYILFYFIMLIW